MTQLGSESVLKMMNNLMKNVLDLAQSSMTEHQFKAFRKLTMDRFAEVCRNLGRCGENKAMTREDVGYD